jgi:hypothetical protein
MLLPVFLPAYANAGSVKIAYLRDTEQAPILVVGRIAAIHKGERIPENVLAWRAETWTMTAELAILRSYSFAESAKPAPGSRINVSFLAYGPKLFSINGSPPPLPNFQSGQVLIFPLQPRPYPNSGNWRLVDDTGLGITIPSRADMPASEPAPKTARAFILQELANALSRGTPQEVSLAGAYVHNQFENLNAELMPLLDESIGIDQQRWAAVIVSLMGVTRPNIEDVRIEGWRDAMWNPSADHGFSIAKTALRKLPASPESDRLLIHALIARAAFAPDYAAFLAEEYADNESFAAPFRAALNKGLVGSTYIAWMLIKGGHDTFIPEALRRASKLINSPLGSELTPAQQLDREAAASLIRQYGGDKRTVPIRG